MDWELVLGVGRFVLATTLLLLLTIPTAFIVIQMELKVIALMQLRYGPNRVGPKGIFQSTIHGFKVLAKEDATPDQADRATFTMAPWMVFMAAAMSMLVIPFAPGLVAFDSSIGVVYFFAVLGLSVVGLLVAGWASYNKYSLLGGLRSAAQMVSYEIPLTLSVVGVVVLTGSLSFTQIIAWQAQHGWAVLWQFWAFPIFFIAATAEINRTPFDMVEADSEIVAGFATEYSGMRFGFFFFAEYVSLFVMSTIVVALFFGGWLAPWPFPAQLGGFIGTLWGLLWFFAKTYFFVFVAVWMRATLPRVRVDQLMGLAWKALLPLALVNLFITAAIVLAFNLQPVGGA
jgi:NADH-quinone oxidoreductase subunit H